MDGNRSTVYSFLRRWFVANTLAAGILALIWLLLRSGPKPSRLTYPCQQAAFTAATAAFGAPLVATLIAARDLAAGLLGRRLLAVAAVGLFATIGVWGFLVRGGAASAPLGLSPPADYRAKVFQVTDCPQDPVGERFPGLDNLMLLMGRRGVKVYRSQATSTLAGPDGIIGSDDVVVIKINYQWKYCGGTNTDLLRGLIRLLVDHPDGFTGEIVVGENAQFVSVENFDREDNNAQDPALSPHDVVQGFRDQGWPVSHSDWMTFLSWEVDEGESCDEGTGYVVLEGDGGLPVSYPRFRTDDGTCVSLKHGVWSGDAFDRSRLKVINLPVLKPHGRVYGVTACVKNYMGVVTTGLDTNSHDNVRSGLMGAVMAEIGPPDLNILDCIWINGNPYNGPPSSFWVSTRTDRLVASTDPVAADIWATTNILVPAFLANGFTPPWPYPDATPDDPDSVFRNYLDRSMDFLLAAGHPVTNDLEDIDLYSWDGDRLSLPRLPAGRAGTRAGRPSISERR